MIRTNILFDSFEIPNPIGTALGLLVGQAIANMYFTTHYKIEHVTVEFGEMGKGLRSYTELSLDDDKTIEDNHIDVEPGQGITRVRIYEREFAGWCDVEFLNNDMQVLYKKESVLPYYTGALVPMIAEFLFSAKVELDMEPKPLDDDRAEGTGSGWFLQEGRPEHVYDSPQEAFEKDTRTPKFFLRLEKAAADLGMLDVAAYFNKIHKQLEIMGYRDNKPTPHPGEMTVNIVSGKRDGSRKWNEDEIKGVAVSQAIEAGLIDADFLTPEQMHFYCIYLKQRAYWKDAVKREQKLASK